MTYMHFTTYNTEKTTSAQLDLELHWQNLFFTIKHREVEGNLSPTMAQEMRTYLEELVHD